MHYTILKQFDMLLFDDNLKLYPKDNGADFLKMNSIN